MRTPTVKRQSEQPIITGAPQPDYIPVAAAFPFLIEGPMDLYEKRIEKLHYHQTIEIGLCIGGKGIFIVEDKAFPFEKDDIIVINHLAMHRAYMPDGKPSRWYFIMLDPPSLLTDIALRTPDIVNTNLLNGDWFPHRFSKTAHPHFFRLVKDMVQEYPGTKRNSKEHIRALVALFLIELTRLKGYGRRSSRLGAHKKTNGLLAQLRPALNIIYQDYTGPLEIKRLAHACAMSVGHFCRQFARIFLKSPLNYIQAYRIDMACSLLMTTDRSVCDIAFSCGYSTLSCFNRQFLKRKKYSPLKWRKRNQISA